ncbi:GNAT family N-acetyltransferase [Haliscomenobacter sp.]|uniref:GNAT family N-acetyltransferase n=1 Tax=Haliscomenobacter sp. TaxID=2717303 RepID=UPI003364DB4A
MQITNSTPADFDTIFALYDEAIAFQKKVFNKQWEGFESSLIETEIRENRQWKIIIDDEVACIFATTLSDAIFWGERDLEPAVYIHRIVTNPKFRGAAFVKIIVEWARGYCLANQLEYIRLDTWGDNPKLIDYYEKCGFSYLKTIDLDNTQGLPAHYKGVLALLEIKI